MNSMIHTELPPYRVGLLGLGTVGLQVAVLLDRFAVELGGRSGRPLQLVRAAVRDVDQHRAEVERRGLDFEVTDSPRGVTEADDVDLVVELVGGIDDPKAWLDTALRRGKDIVTANKAVLARHGEALFDLAVEHHGQILFEGAVAGAIPILQIIRDGLTAGPITRLTGILNGSTNWLLDEMAHGTDRPSALARARELGLLEQDPTLDLSGEDARHKLALLARLLTGCRVDAEAIRCHGIVPLDERDLRFGQERSLSLKLVATMRRADHDEAESGPVELGVYPEWLEASHPLASVPGEDNAILLEGPTFDRLLFQGKGAGGAPTAGSVVADIVRAARGSGHLIPSHGELSVADPLSNPRSYYVRVAVRDAPGILAAVARVFADDEISLATVRQDARSRTSEEPVDLFLVTHPTSISALTNALSRLEATGAVEATPVWIPFSERIAL